MSVDGTVQDSSATFRIGSTIELSLQQDNNPYRLGLKNSYAKLLLKQMVLAFRFLTAKRHPEELR